MALDMAPEELVAMLNSFFALVVDIVERHDGWVNKFEGDAALAVFGAPQGVADHAGSALAAARELAAAIASGHPRLAAGIGVSSGMAVAGNIGDPRRYEYTVVGDPVNEAARWHRGVAVDAGAGRLPRGGPLARCHFVRAQGPGHRDRYRDALGLETAGGCGGQLPRATSA